MRRWSILVALALGSGCGPSVTEGVTDAAPRADAPVDAEATFDAPVPPDAAPDAVPGSAVTCETCTANSDCAAGWLCILTGAGRLCLPECSVGMPDCPDDFTCAGVDSTYCAPVNGVCCLDADDDGWGDGVSCFGTDCDDSDPAVNPGAPDLCNDIDDDCDPGTGDGEGDPAVGAPCDGPDLDMCAEGTGACGPGGIACSDTSGDNPELCNGIDDDCVAASPDGSGDPAVGFACDGPDGDLCQEGTASCTGGMLSCNDTSGTTLDFCNGADEDCDPATTDGADDPTIGDPCDGTDGDLCQEGTIVCSGGLACSDTTGGSVETCNGIDDDCNPATPDGASDPGIGGGCDGPDSDACLEGVVVCAGGALSCNDASLSDLEICDGVDNDCDVLIDEGFDTTSDALNCGACGNVCSGLCCASSCTPASGSNCGACGHSCTTGMLIVNELFIDPNAVADAQGEWFEVYNPNPWTIDLRGFEISDAGVDTHTITSTVPVLAPPMGYVVLGNNANSTTNGGLTVAYQYAGFQLGNSGDEARVDAFGTMLDEVVWASSFDVSGKSKELSRNHRTATANDNVANWCTAVNTFGSGDFGTPGLQNACVLP